MKKTQFTQNTSEDGKVREAKVKTNRVDDLERRQISDERLSAAIRKLKTMK